MLDQSLTTTQAAPPPAATHDFGAVAPYNPNINAGAVAIEEARAIAEVRGQIIIAQQFPRSVAQATADFMEACKSEEFALTAFYSVPNRGSGPSIRFAEEAARCYGNFQYGHRELSRSEGKSEIEVYAWDVQKNNRSIRQITVMHIRDKKNANGGPVLLTDQTDIDNRVANVASKQMRGRILALLPKALVAEGVAMAKRTLAGDNEKPIAQRVSTMVQVFQKNFGVTAEMLATYIGHPLDNITVDELADLRGVAEALRDGAKPNEYFGTGEVTDEAAPAATNTRLDAASKTGGGKAAPKKADPKAETKPEPKPETKPEEPAPETKPEVTPPEETKPPVTEPRPAEPAQEGDQRPEPPHEEQEQRVEGPAPSEQQEQQAPTADPAAAAKPAEDGEREAMF